VLRRSIVDEDEIRVCVLHLRQDVKLMAFLLAGISSCS
jgi:hypothetical protein